MGREESIWVHKPQDAGTRQSNKCELVEEKEVLGDLLCSRGQDLSPCLWQCQIACIFADTVEAFPVCVVQVHALHRYGQECMMEFGKPWIPCVHREVTPGDAALRCWRLHCWQVI